MHMTAGGSDDLAGFEVHLPGSCDSCGKTVEVAIKYHASNVSRALKKRGVDGTPSLILRRPWGIGVTCGCYARFHRQLAHITEAQRRKTGKKSD